MTDRFWSGRRVFVTGATGLVGAWLVKSLLAEGAYVVTLIRDADPQSELFRSGDYKQTAAVHGRLEDFSALERAINEHEIDTVFHLAAQPIVGVAHRFPLQTFESNIRGTYNLLEVCRIHSGLVKRVVIASSDKAYGEQPVLPYTEDLPLQGRHPYEVSKSCADMIAQSYFHTYLWTPCDDCSLWKYLWRRRSKLEPDCPCHRPLAFTPRAPSDSQRWVIRARLYLRQGCDSRLYDACRADSDS